MSKQKIILIIEVGKQTLKHMSVAYPGGVLRVLEHPPKAQEFN